MENGTPGRLPPWSSHCANSRGGGPGIGDVFSSFLFSLSALVLPLLVLALVRSVQQKGGWWETMVFYLCPFVVFHFTWQTWHDLYGSGQCLENCGR